MDAKGALPAFILAYPRDVRFVDACKAAELRGFAQGRGAGTHCTFTSTGKPIDLNFRNRGQLVLSYQARQPALMIEAEGDKTSRTLRCCRR